MGLVVYILLQFLCVFESSNGMEDKFTVERDMEKIPFQIDFATRLTDMKTQKCVAVIRAPINTEVDIREPVDNGEWRLSVSPGSDGASALYNATVTAAYYEYLRLPVRLYLGKETMIFHFNNFLEREKQADFKFENCQFQVEKKSSLVSTTYKIIIRSCDCYYTFQADVRKGSKYTISELSPLYFSTVITRGRSMQEDGFASISINQTALSTDGAGVTSLEFAIGSRYQDEDIDVIHPITYRYSLI